ncbi:hypothetical protein [Acidiplasma cupricumulans]|uniref:hypothetical protein n=1 Tax=Acidiplasma cupricumulans TaxID=312540 RepID=UPI000781AB53|nr:hypothetical protein [Acidiplasma cupricumulans]
MTATSVNIIDDMKRHSFLGYLGSGDSMDYVDANLINDSKSIFFEGYNLIKRENIQGINESGDGCGNSREVHIF